MSQNVKVYRTLEFYAQGGATRMSTIDTDESATILYWKPETDDTGYLAIGDGTKDMDVKIFLSTAAKYVLFDVGNVLLQLEDVDLLLGDNDELRFGDATGGDVVVKWNATNLTIIPATDNTGVFEVGNDGTKSMDVKFYGATASSYLLWDNSDDRLELDGADLNLQDSDILQFGDAQDVAITWNATNLVITPAVDDTGAIYFGNGTLDMDVRVHQGTATDYVEFDVGAKALEVVGDTRIDLSSATVAAANTDGGLIRAGTSGTPIVEDTADMKFVSFYFDNGATSGDNRGIYNRLYLTGAGGGGESLRSYTDVSVACGTAHGAHISLGFGESTTVGSITGLGVATRSTLGIPNGAMPAGGTYAAIEPEIYCFGANATVAAVTELSFIRCSNAGNATGVGLVDDKAYLIVLDGGSIASGNIVESSTTEANYAYSVRVKLGGTVMYLMAASAVG